MDTWLSRNETLVRENEQLKIKLQNATTENRQLKSHLQSITNNTLEELTLPGGSSQPQLNTLTEQQFRETFLKNDPRTSSPVDFRSLIESSMYAEPSTDTGFESEDCGVKEERERLLGEIVFQLNRRILSYVFPCNKRFYGYNLTNITSKIIEVSTHPLTGKMDEDYRLHLTQRYNNIQDTLSRLGYKTTLHPQFSEFVINNYGILPKRPKEGSPQETDYYNPAYLKSVVTTTAPVKLQKDLLVLLDCLCSLAERDGKPLLLW